MGQILSTPAASFVLLLAGAATLIAIGVYVVGKVRQDLTGETVETNHLLSNFREMHTQGELSDEEYRTIKAMLAKRLEDELKSGSREDDKHLDKDSGSGQDEAS
jgi:uncharacterized membrane protein